MKKKKVKETFKNKTGSVDGCEDGEGDEKFLDDDIGLPYSALLHGCSSRHA